MKFSIVELILSILQRLGRRSGRAINSCTPSQYRFAIHHIHFSKAKFGLSYYGPSPISKESVHELSR